MQRFIGVLFVILSSLDVQAALPESLTFKADAIYPEGIAYDEKSQSFYVSSIRQGKIGRVSAAGEYFEFWNDDELISTVGMWVDAPRNRLLACVSDPGVGKKTKAKSKEKVSHLVVIDLASRKKTHSIELGGLTGKTGNVLGKKHFCNDLTTDNKGNVYITDSFSPFIYRVTSEYKSSMWLANPKFRGKGFGLNGIVYHPSGYLLVAKYDDGTLWKVEIKNKAVTQVALPEAYPNLDGLVLISKNEIAGIQNGNDNKLRKFKSSDDWKTAKVEKTIETGLKFPTTGVMVGKKIYVLEGKLGELFADPSKALSQEYSIKGFDL